MEKQYLTQEGLEELKKELAERKEKRKAITKRIKEAKELGDLSENADYTDAKDAQAFNEGRIAEIEEILQRAEVISGGNGDTITVGSHITLQQQRGETREYQLVGASEADPTKGKISNKSPIGKALLGKTSGDEVRVETPNGTTTYTITDVS